MYNEFWLVEANCFDILIAWFHLLFLLQLLFIASVLELALEIHNNTKKKKDSGDF